VRGCARSDSAADAAGLNGTTEAEDSEKQVLRGLKVPSG
jgi:hypothetical protein